MAFIIKTIKTVRNNWKKSTVASIAVVYCYGRYKNHNETQALMRLYSLKAAKYGSETIPVESEPRNITVILNPTANKRKSIDDFENYCAPLLNLAGVCVNVVKTESEGHAKNLINEINATDALVVAGGDGTLSEILTGLLRRTQENTSGLVSIGILPLGKTNTLASNLFPNRTKIQKVAMLAEATMAVIEQATKPIDILRIEAVNEENKPIYAVSGIKWGAYRDAQVKKDSYWYWGSLKKYVTYVFNGYKSSLTWNCTADLIYSPPCSGCSNCVRKQVEESQGLFGRFRKADMVSARHILNPTCSIFEEKSIHTTDFELSVAEKEEIPKLEINIGPKNLDYLSFVKEGWNIENGIKPKYEEIISARAVEIKPKLSADRWFSIDNENFELKAIKVTLLPKLVNVFCKKESVN